MSQTWFSKLTSLNIGSSNSDRDDYWFTRKGEENVSHVKFIGSGGFGEVHEVTLFGSKIMK